LKERKQFGAPLPAFQLNQEKLVRMLGDIQAMVLVGWRLCKLYESGKMTSGHSSLGKVRKLQYSQQWLNGSLILSPMTVSSSFFPPAQSTDSN